MGGALASRLGLGSKREVEKEQLVPKDEVELEELTLTLTPTLTPTRTRTRTRTLTLTQKP